MVPSKVDLQRDFAREETIRGFADQFETFVEAGQAGGGVMHAVWPDDWMALERNEVLDEAEAIGGQTVDAGAWVQEWSIENDDLWALISDGILAGYSIGAIQVGWDGPYEQDEDAVDDVDASEVSDDDLVWELTEGIIREVSAVDIPAVPDAEILETKSETEKRLGSYLGDPDGFMEEAMERGHSEQEAERLWDVLNDAVAADGSDEPGKQSALHRAGKAFVNALTGGSDASASDPNPTPTSAADKEAGDFEADIFRVVAPEEDADNYEDAVLGIGVDFPNSDVYVDWRNEVFPDELDDPHVSIYGSIADLEQATGNSTEQMDSLNAKAAKGLVRTFGHDVESTTDNAAGGDTPEQGSDTKDAADDMTDPDDNPGGDKTLAEENAEQINELTAAVGELTEAITGPQPKTAEIEIDGETYEVPEDAAKAALGVDEDAGVGVADAIESLKAQVDDVAGRVDTIAQQSGHSQQLAAKGGGEGDDNGEKESGLDALGGALS